MEVLKYSRKAAPLALAPSSPISKVSKFSKEEMNLTTEQGSSLGGQTLIQTVVSLTELPETWVHQEMDEILKASGHRSENLTLEQLRAAMISYLEAIQADFENDANALKASVIVE